MSTFSYIKNGPPLGSSFLKRLSVLISSPKYKDYSIFGGVLRVIQLPFSARDVPFFPIATGRCIKKISRLVSEGYIAQGEVCQIFPMENSDCSDIVLALLPEIITKISKIKGIDYYNGDIFIIAHKQNPENLASQIAEKAKHICIVGEMPGFEDFSDMLYQKHGVCVSNISLSRNNLKDAELIIVDSEARLLSTLISEEALCIDLHNTLERKNTVNSESLRFEAPDIPCIREVFGKYLDAKTTKKFIECFSSEKRSIKDNLSTLGIYFHSIEI